MPDLTLESLNARLSVVEAKLGIVTPTTPSETPTPTQSPLVVKAQLMVPATVHFCTPVLPPNAQDCKFEWDFGDGSAPMRSNGLDGWNSAHVYDQVGKYIVSLTITPLIGEPITYMDTVETTPSGRRIIPIDETLASFTGSNATLLFKGGGTYGPIKIKGSNIVIGAYGDGDAPILASETESLISLDPACDGVLIRDLQCNTSKRFVEARGKNIVVQSCNVIKAGRFYNGEAKPAFVALLDNTSLDVEGLRDYFAWMDGTYITIAGNTVVNSAGEHICRSSSQLTEWVSICDNDFENSTGIAIGDKITKTCVNFRLGKKGYVARNRFKQGTNSFGPTNDIWNGNASINSLPIKTPVELMVFRDNVVTDGGYVEIVTNVKNVSILNNKMAVRLNFAPDYTPDLIRLEPTRKEQPGARAENVRVDGNDCENLNPATNQAGKQIKAYYDPNQAIPRFLKLGVNPYNCPFVTKKAVDVHAGMLV